MKFLADIEVEEGLKDSDGSSGSNGQVLSSANNGTATEWIDAPGTIGGSIADNQIAVGASTTNTIEGNSYFSYVPFTLDGSVASARLKVRGRLEMSDDLLSGTANLYVGFGAGGTSSQGSNTGVGIGALQDQISGVSGQGSKNCALGKSALYNLTLGAGNIGIGYQSLFGLIGTGQNDNTAVGTNAALYYSTGTDQLTQSSQGVYIGSDTRASANNISNEIAIGYGVVGGGSDTITLGNSSVDLLRIPGLNATNNQVLTYNATAGGFKAAAAAGGGTIGGSITSTQIAVGDGTNSIEGSSLLTLTNVSSGSGANDMLRIGNGTTGENQVLLDINTKGTATSRGRLTLSDAGTLMGYLGITGGTGEVTLFSNANLVLSGGGKVQIDGGSTSDIVIASASGSNVGIGNTSPDEKLDVTGRIKASAGVQVGNETGTSAVAGLVGTLRYKLVNGSATAGTNYSYVDMVMQTGATGGLASYEWVNIVTNRW